MPATPYPTLAFIASDLRSDETLREYARRTRVRKPNRRSQLAQIVRNGRQS